MRPKDVSVMFGRDEKATYCRIEETTTDSEEDPTVYNQTKASRECDEEKKLWCEAWWFGACLLALPIFLPAVG